MARRFIATKPSPQTKFVTSDGRRFDTPPEAANHQFEIDFDLWYSDPENVFRGIEGRRVRDWLLGHAADIKEMLG